MCRCCRRKGPAGLQRWCRWPGRTALRDTGARPGPRRLPQTVQVGTVRSPALPNLDGVLGSDTLSSFGAVRIDYLRQTLTLGPQTAPLRSDVAGGSGPLSISPSLTAGTSFATTMPVNAVSETLSPHQLQLTEVGPTVDVSSGPNQFTLTLDTGAGATNLDPSVVSKLRLTSGPSGLRLRRP